MVVGLIGFPRRALETVEWSSAAIFASLSPSRPRVASARSNFCGSRLVAPLMGTLQLSVPWQVPSYRSFWISLETCESRNEGWRHPRLLLVPSRRYRDWKELYEFRRIYSARRRSSIAAYESEAFR